MLVLVWLPWLAANLPPAAKLWDFGVRSIHGLRKTSLTWSRCLFFFFGTDDIEKISVVQVQTQKS